MKRNDSQIMTARLSAIFFAGLFLLAACGRDYNTDDYQRERLEKNLANTRAADGVYTGLAISNIDGSTLGALQISVTSGTNVIVNPNDQSNASAQPNVQAAVTLTGPSMSIVTDSAKLRGRKNATSDNIKMNIVFQNGQFDVNSNGLFEAEYEVDRMLNGVQKKDVIKITGNIENGHFIGNIFSKTAPNLGASFDLMKNGQPAAALLKGRKLASDKFRQQVFYKGHTYFSNNVKKPVELVLTQPTTTDPSDDSFLNLLVENRPVVATLNYGNGAELSFTNAMYDAQTGVLTGSAVVSQIFSAQSEAQQIQTLMTLSCSKHSNQITECDITQAANPGVAAKTYVIASKSSYEPPDNSDTRNAVTRIYSGTIQYFPDPAKTPVYLTVIYSARTRMQEIFDLLFPLSEKTVQVSWQEQKNRDIGTEFQSVKWDALNGTLDATQQAQLPGGQLGNGASGAVTLSCSNFFYYERVANFNCQYMNTIGNVSGSMQFNGHPIKLPAAH